MANVTLGNPHTWSKLDTALVWCLAWGPKQKCGCDRDQLKAAIELLRGLQKPEDGQSPGKPDVSAISPQIQDSVDLVWEFNQKAVNFQGEGFPMTAAQVQQLLGEPIGIKQVGLVYGGATKIKQYVFEGAKLPDVRGASALLDRINGVDLPAFFGKYSLFRSTASNPDCTPLTVKNKLAQAIEPWLEQQAPGLYTALIDELIIYSTGGNILAFCPPAFVDVLADAIEARYTEETLTANSCAVGQTFRLLELLLGALPLTDNGVNWWLDTVLQQQNVPESLILPYFRQKGQLPEQCFQKRKSFNELVTKLAIAFNQRRAGMVVSDERLTRRYPPMLETHPYLMRDDHERRLAIAHLKANAGVPSDANLSDVLARKRYMGQLTKRLNPKKQWFETLALPWKPLPVYPNGNGLSWVLRFRQFLQGRATTVILSQEIQCLKQGYYTASTPRRGSTEARSLREIGNVTDPGQGFVAYIYADGNNMGGYIQNLRTPQEYQQFSEDVSEATEQAVYIALAKHLEVRQILNFNAEPGEENREGAWIHPFEIVTIGGDDVFLIVPADKALAIAQSIGEEFEKILLKKGDRYKVIPEDQQKDSQSASQPDVSPHRYQNNESDSSAKSCKEPCQLSMSIGVLITAEKTPIYYAQNLVEQLLKSAKKRAKFLKEEYHYYGGTIDFLVLKSVTMISSNISEFRKQALEIEPPTKPDSSQTKGHILKLYGGPYTLHEIGGLLQTLQALKDSDFPKSQLYQIRSFLAQGKRTAILNYRYFRTRLRDNKGQDLKAHFEAPWCGAKTNGGNLAPWMASTDPKDLKDPEDPKGKTTYTTIWRDLVDLLPFYSPSRNQPSPDLSADTTDPQTQEAHS